MKKCFVYIDDSITKLSTNDIEVNLEKLVAKLLADGYDYFIFSGRSELDLLIINLLKGKTEVSIKTELALPFCNTDKHWSIENKQRLDKIKLLCDTVSETYKRYRRSCLVDYMTENIGKMDILLTACSDSLSYISQYKKEAIKNNKPIIDIFKINDLEGL